MGSEGIVRRSLGCDILIEFTPSIGGGGDPRFIAALSTYDGPDNAHLRYDAASLSDASVSVMVEEDTCGDTETDHTTEVVDFLAIVGEGTLEAVRNPDPGYEGPEEPITRTYYYHGSRRVAMRVDNGVTETVYYLHGDHLGSTSLVTDEAGEVVARQGYLPYGQVRWSVGTLPTDWTYTGQRDDAGTGLMFYRARYYRAYHCLLMECPAAKR